MFSIIVRPVSQFQVPAVYAVLDRTATRHRPGRGARHVVREPFAAVLVTSNVVVALVCRRVGRSVKQSELPRRTYDLYKTDGITHKIILYNIKQYDHSIL